MNTNERLTEAARRGARGHTSAGKTAFQSLPDDKQKALINWVTMQPALTDEIVRTSLLAMPADEIEDMLNSMGEARDDAAKEQQLHTGDSRPSSAYDDDNGIGV